MHAAQRRKSNAAVAARVKHRAFGRRFLGALVWAWAVGGNAGHAAYATTITDPARIAQVAREHVYARAKAIYPDPIVEVGTLDPRLRLPDCQRLEAELPSGTRVLGNVHVGVRCKAPSTWLVYVPVKIAAEELVVSTAGPLARGQVVQVEHIVVARRDIASLPAGYAREPSSVVGKRVRQPLAAGAVITQAALDTPPIVRRGEPVTIVATSGALEIRAAGEALDNGAQGDTVKVRNVSSRRTLVTRVLAPGRVTPIR